jgi:rRNA maturation endonuclease Nob1
LLAVADNQLEKAMALMDDDFLDSLSDREKEISQMVVNHNASRTQCPGCLTEFTTGPSECPDCGLFIGAPGSL